MADEKEFEEQLMELNNIGMLTNKDWTPFKKLTELTINCVYPIKKISIIQGKYGPGIIAEMDEFKVNLPKRFHKTLSEGTIEILNKRNKLALKYVGLKDNKYALVEFVI